MAPHTLDTQMLTPVSLTEAFSIFENPYNLARITPANLGFQVTSKERVVMRKGAEITYKIKWMGIPLSWKTLITEYNPPHSFVDEQAKGPYVLWRHRHTFRETASGTIVGDHVEYILPLGFLGRLVHRLVVRRQLEKIFEYRQQALTQLFNEVSGAAQLPAATR